MVIRSRSRCSLEGFKTLPKTAFLSFFSSWLLVCSFFLNIQSPTLKCSYGFLACFLQTNAVSKEEFCSVFTGPKATSQKHISFSRTNIGVYHHIDMHPLEASTESLFIMHLKSKTSSSFKSLLLIFTNLKKPLESWVSTNLHGK